MILRNPEEIASEVHMSEVLDHWSAVENLSDLISARVGIIYPLLRMAYLTWNHAELKNSVLMKIYIISSDDWIRDGLCTKNDFRLSTALNNFRTGEGMNAKINNIKMKVNAFEKDPEIMGTKLILVAPRLNGPFTIIEGNKRSVALAHLSLMPGLQIYLGISPEIETYFWARYS